MAKSIALAADASRRASLLLSYIPAVCAFVAPRQPGASTAIIDRLSHSRALSRSALRRLPARAANLPRCAAMEHLKQKKTRRVLFSRRLAFSVARRSGGRKLSAAGRLPDLVQI